MSAIQLEQVEAQAAAAAGRRQSNALRQLDLEVAKKNALAGAAQKTCLLFFKHPSDDDVFHTLPGGRSGRKSLSGSCLQNHIRPARGQP